MSKALIIDDEVQLRRLLRMLLEARGYETVEAATAQAGIEQACISCPDVVLLDLGLPDSDGVTVLRRLREWTDVPVLVLSVRNQESVKVAALEAGADDYVTKPFGAAELLARLQANQAEGLRVHINHIRKKLDSNKIKIMNEPGIGYRLLASGAAN